MLQADLEAQKAVEPVSSSRESEEECFNIQKPSVYQCNQSIYHSFYVHLWHCSMSLASFGDTLAFPLKAFVQKD